MVIVGELINASRKAIGRAIEAQDEAAIAEVAQKQFEAGAHYIDVNAGAFVGREIQYLPWLVKVVQGAISAPCCLDSPDPEVIQAALKVHQGAAMINSISLEKERWDSLLPIVAGGGLKVIALCMSDEGMPETAEQRLAIADKMINSLVQNNVKLDDIYVDPLVQPISVDSAFGWDFLLSVRRIMEDYQGVHTACGLSNVSFGLPKRVLLNRVYMAMAIANGLDGAIVDPLDRGMMAQIAAAEALRGRDDYCSEYLTAYRDKRLEP